MICETCNIEHDGSYGSGRFCSMKCARMFSTKEKRSERNEKIQKSLKGRTSIFKGKKRGPIKRNRNNPDYVIPQRKEKRVLQTTCFCEVCGIEFQLKKPGYIRKTCSSEHAHKLTNTQETRRKLSLKRTDAILHGVTNGYGVKCAYRFKNVEIKCDSMLEYACVDYCVERLNPIEIIRSKLRIQYDFEGIERTFNPDFEVIDKTGVKFLVECKGTHVTQALNDKWHDYCEKALVKKDILAVYCANNNMTSLWFDESMHRKFYKSIRKNRIPKTEFAH